MALLLLGCGPSAREQELEKAVETLMAAEKARLEEERAAEEARLEEERQNFDLKGSVFIVTRGQTSHKLGLTPVAAVSRADFQAIVSNANDVVSDFIDENRESYLELAALLTPIQNRHDSIKSEVKKEISELKDRVSAYDANVDGIDVYGGLREVSALKSQRSAATKIQTALNTKIDSINAKIDSFTKDEENAADQLYAKINAIENAARELENSFQRSLAAAIVAGSSSSTKTNADGEFSFNLKRGIDYVIVAYADRSVGDSSEAYNWFIDYKTPLVRAEDTILVSNDNLAPDTSEMTEGLSIFEDVSYYNSIPSKRDHFTLDFLD